MSDELLTYFNRELEYLRSAGAEFARAHPKIAGRLGLGQGTVEDPHISRLIESVAFLNARVAKKVDDDLPEVSEALLSILAPHQLAPLPSMAIVRFEASPDLTSIYSIPAGTMIESDPAYGSQCQFQTIYETEALPVVIEEATLRGAPLDCPEEIRGESPSAVLKIRLAPAARGVAWSDLGVSRLRVFLAGQETAAHQLYELLNDAVVGVVVRNVDSGAETVQRGSDSIQSVGFDRDEGLFPDKGRAHPGDLLLAEFFAFPEKFLFLDVENLDCSAANGAKAGIEIHIYLQRTYQALESGVTKASFALGCAPVINLFSKRAEPIDVDGSKSYYHVLPDARQPEAHEVYSVDSVTAITREGRRFAFAPFYGVNHGAVDGESGHFFHASRKEASGGEGRDVARGTEVELALVDLDFQEELVEDSVLEVQVTCLSRDLPGLLPFGGSEPRMRFRDGGGGIERIECVTRPTKTVRRTSKRGATWRAVSQLSLNHLSVTGGKKGAEALRELLRVNDLVDTPSTRAIIGSVRSVEGEGTMIRMQTGSYAGFCRGLAVHVDLDESQIDSAMSYLFGAILSHTFGLHASPNSFVQLTTSARELESGVRRWPARTGHKSLF